ncbi:MAG: hypothetical protein JNM81_13880 [Rhodospirillaceae bacterium]|nr:hypothetical protein [Rhodospirillaceae bacterium]
MSDNTTPDAGGAMPANGSALSLSEAVQILADRRADKASASPSTPDPVNDNASESAAYSSGEHDDSSHDLIAGYATSDAAQNPDPQSENDLTSATIDIDGVQLTADDIRRGYMRQADYSRKTQRLAEASRSVEAERTVKLARLDQLIDSLGADFTQEPNWVQVARADPQNWVQRKIQWDNRRAAFENAKRISDAVHADTLDRDRKIMVEELASTYNPAWADAQTRVQDFKELARYALNLGFGPEEVAGISHAREMMVLDKARRWDALQNSKASTAKRLSVVPKVQRPGAKSTVGSHQRNLGSAWERFLKNPTVENGAAYQRAKREAASFRRNSD